MPKKPQLKKRVRVNYRLQQDLVAWVKKYAKKNNTTFTGVVVDALSEFKRGHA